MQIDTIAVVGPRGSVGSAIITALLSKGAPHQITALIRPESKYQRPESTSNINVVTADFNDSSSLVAALTGQDAILCCVPGGATQFASQKLLIDAAIEARVKLFFADEFISDVMSPHFQLFPAEVVGDKSKVRKYLVRKAMEGKIAWTALNGGPFFDMWLDKGVAGFNIPTRTATIYGAGTNPSCWTPLPVIADTVARMIQNPDRILNRPVFINGVKGITQNNILAALEAELGAKFKVEHVDVKKIKKEALEALEKGERMKVNRGLALNSQFNEEDGWADFGHLVNNELVGVEAIDVKMAVREYLRERHLVK